MGLIYKITNKINGKIYIGKTVQEFERTCRPQAYKSCVVLSAAFDKYGWDNFTKEIIEDNIEESQLALKEEHYIKQFDCMVPNGYNIISVYNGLNRYTDETKKKISNSRKEYLADLDSKGIVLTAANKKEHTIIEGVAHKNCTKCKTNKTLDKFPKNNSRWDGLWIYCKDCHNNRISSFRKANPAKKLSDEEFKQSYENRRHALSVAVRSAYESNPEIKNKQSKAKNKPIIGVSISDGSIIKFESAKLAKLQGFDNTNIGKSIKTGVPYKGYRWMFE